MGVNFSSVIKGKSVDPHSFCCNYKQNKWGSTLEEKQETRKTCFVPPLLSRGLAKERRRHGAP